MHDENHDVGLSPSVVADSAHALNDAIVQQCWPAGFEDVTVETALNAAVETAVNAAAARMFTKVNALRKGLTPDEQPLTVAQTALYMDLGMKRELGGNLTQPEAEFIGACERSLLLAEEMKRTAAWRDAFRDEYARRRGQKAAQGSVARVAMERARKTPTPLAPLPRSPGARSTQRQPARRAAARGVSASDDAGGGDADPPPARAATGRRKSNDQPSVDWKGLDAIVLAEAGVSQRGSDTVVPYYAEDGRLYREKVFPAAGRSYWGAGEGLIPLGLERLPSPECACESILIVCEGESDAFSLRGARVVWRDRPVFALGLPGASTWQADWARWAVPFPVIYLIGDGDTAGRAMAARLRGDLPWARPVRLPDGEDARSLLQRHGPDALDGFLEQADRLALLGAAILVAPTLRECRQLLAAGGAFR